MPRIYMIDFNDLRNKVFISYMYHGNTELYMKSIKVIDNMEIAWDEQIKLYENPLWC